MAKKDVRTQVEEEFKDFVEEIQIFESSELDSRLAQLAKYQEEVIQQKAADEQLASLKEELKQMGAAYREAMRALRLKSRYIILKLKDRGES